MHEQRIDRRYKGIRGRPAALEGASWRVIGRIIDVSKRGIGVKPEQLIGYPSVGDKIRIEVALEAKLFIETGTLVRMETGRLGAQLNGTMDSCVFAELKEDGFSFAVSEEVAIIDGLLKGSAAKNDLLEITRRRLAIDLRRTRNVDSAGVTMLLSAFERGARLSGCSRPVAMVMKDAGACDRCGSCEGATAQ